MRGLAVLPVLFYHAGIPGWAGGFVGVDVFFVLSGYLITGLLARELTATGRIALASFYARRCRRILPAASLVLVATVAASARWLPPLRAADVTVDALWATAFSANLHFAWQATDYLQADLDPSPLLHYWSLGVEEQFYLLWPALLLLGRSRSSRLGGLALAIAGVVVASFALSLWLTATNLPWAFFSLPARAWELGIGGLLAVIELRGVALPASAAAAAGWLGVALIAAAVAAFGADTAFPGTAALVPALGAVLLIAAGDPGSRRAPNRLLATAVPRFVGRISYSLYLWSWPLIVVATGAAARPLTLGERLALVALSVPLAASSQSLVEQPLRQGRLIGRAPRRGLVFGAGLTLAVVVVSLATYEWMQRYLVTAGVRGEDVRPQIDGPLPADVSPPLAAVRNDMVRSGREGCHAGQTETGVKTCAYGVPDSPRTVVLFGDSGANQWFPALEPIAAARSWRLLVRTKSACGAPDAPVWNYAFKREYVECGAWREAVLRDLAVERPALVIISGVRRISVMEGGVVVNRAAAEAVWAAAMERTIRRLQGLGARVVLIGDAPRPAGDAPSCLSAHLDDIGACATPRRVAIDDGWRAIERGVVAATGADYIDTTDWVCPTEPCPPVISSRLVFRDTHHLTVPLVELLEPRLAAALERVTAGKGL